MAISMTKLSSADYYLDRTREALQADGAIPDEATPGPLTGCLLYTSDAADE